MDSLDSPHCCCVGLTSHLQTIIISFNQFMLTPSKTARDLASVSSACSWCFSSDHVRLGKVAFKAQVKSFI